MKETEKIAFYELLTGISLNYGTSLNELTFKLWWKGFKGVEFSVIQAALEGHVFDPKKGQYMPKIADVTKRLEEISPELKALMAWDLVVENLGKAGAYCSVEFEDTLIHAVIRGMGGWIALCRSDVRNLPFLARDFDKRYQGFLAHPPLFGLEPLCGSLEHENRVANPDYVPPKPSFIANKPLRRLSPVHLLEAS